jgi:hypothetical protein
MMNPSKGAEAAIDQRLSELELQVRHGTAEGIVQRDALRPRYERIAADYLSLKERGNGSQYLGLKVLATLDVLRSRDIAAQGIRLASIGPYTRRRWPDSQHSRSDLVTPSSGQTAGTTRAMRRSLRPFPHVSEPPADAADIDLVGWDAVGTDILDLSRVLILHLGFVGDDLLVALDSNLEVFFYGRDAVRTDHRVRWEPFKEYGYEPLSLEPERLVFGPIRCPRTRTKLLQHAHLLNDLFDVDPEANPTPALLRSVMDEIEQMIGYRHLMDSLEGWANSRGWSLSDICLVILPDEALFTLPLSFLGASRGEPLITRLGGVSIALSLVALKWAAKDYHWYTSPNLTTGRPRCVLFAAPGDGVRTLDLQGEIAGVSAGFGTRNCMVLSNPSRADFSLYYSAGDVCWFAGHGEYAPTRGLEMDGTVIPFALTGPVFADAPLTNLDLIATSNWNFKALWLSVMNTCLLGRSLLAGSNPMGFVSALYSVGSIATVGALWPVKNSPATTFAQNLAARIPARFHDRDFPRARAVSEALRKAIGADRERQWQFAPYSLWGLP